MDPNNKSGLRGLTHDWIWVGESLATGPSLLIDCKQTTNSPSDPCKRLYPAGQITQTAWDAPNRPVTCADSACWYATHSHLVLSSTTLPIRFNRVTYNRLEFMRRIQDARQETLLDKHTRGFSLF